MSDTGIRGLDAQAARGDPLAAAAAARARCRAEGHNVDVRGVYVDFDEFIMHAHPRRVSKPYQLCLRCGERLPWRNMPPPIPDPT